MAVLILTIGCGRENLSQSLSQKRSDRQEIALKEKQDSSERLCVDGIAILHEKEGGKLRELPYGGCGSEDGVDYYQEQVGGFLALNPGWEDLSREDSQAAKKLLKQIHRYLEKKHCPVFPVMRQKLQI